MKTKLQTQLLSLAAIVAIGLSGCGGSDDAPITAIPYVDTTSATGTTQTTNTVTGVVATGVGVPANIELIDSLGHSATAVSDSTGVYTVNVSNFTAPYILRATLNTDGSILYSYVDIGESVANVTPLTTYLVDQAAIVAGDEGGASQLYTDFTAHTTPANISSYIQSQIETLDAAIDPVLLENNMADFNHFSDVFTANHTGYDAVLDDLDIEVYQDDVIIRTDSGTLDTLNYPIETATVDFSGNLVDVTTQSPISGATVSMTDSDGTVFSTSSDRNGTFSISVDTMRVYDITISATGYQTQLLPNIPSFVFTDASVGDIAMYPDNLATTTVLSGTLIDGRTSNTGIANATLTFRSGYGERINNVVATVTTNSNGWYSVNLPSGPYTVEIEGSDYYTIYSNVDAYGDSRTLDFSLLGDLAAVSDTNFFATITLNWDANPSDLDSHLTGPALVDGGNRFHLYYGHGTIWPNNSSASSSSSDSVCTNGEIASLDRDRTSANAGLLPETVTLCSVEAGGIYKYYVHQYAGSETMSNGNAQVTVATNNGTTRTFAAPTAGNTGYHDIWHVFNIDSFGNIYPVNEIIGNGYDTSSLFEAPILYQDKFSAENGIMDNLPSK